MLRTNYRSVQFLHGFHCVISIFKMDESIVFDFFDPLYLAIGFKLLFELFFCNIWLEVSYVQHFHLEKVFWETLKIATEAHALVSSFRKDTLKYGKLKLPLTLCLNLVPRLDLPNLQWCHSPRPVFYQTITAVWLKMLPCVIHILGMQTLYSSSLSRLVSCRL